MSTNPYLDTVLALFGNEHEPLYADQFSLDSAAKTRVLGIRQRLVEEYSWAIPDANAIRRIAALQPIVEFGAGSGYWAQQLSEAGVRIRAFDVTSSNRWFGVEEDDGSLLGKFADHTLLLCWPPFGSSMAAKTLGSFAGETVIYIGEPRGGCTADDDFFDMLSADFVCIETSEIPKWPGIHDKMHTFRRMSRP